MEKMREFGTDSQNSADGVGIDRFGARYVRCWRTEEKSKEGEQHPDERERLA